MNDFPNHHAWQQTLAMLALISSPPRFDERKNPSTLLDERLARELESSRVVPRSPASALIKILERRSPTSVTVCWCDATSGRYGDQLWALGVSPRQAICALSGLQIRRGDAVYRPHSPGRSRPSNAGLSILASVVSPFDVHCANK